MVILFSGRSERKCLTPKGFGIVQYARSKTHRKLLSVICVMCGKALQQGRYIRYQTPSTTVVRVVVISDLDIAKLYMHTTVS